MAPTAEPSWLKLAASSDKHITKVLHVLAARESKRHMARAISQQRALDPSESIPTVRPLASFLNRKPDVQPHHVEHYSVAAGVHKENRGMNRYLDIIPYDRTRVIVGEDKDHSQEQAGKLHGRYLNANWVMERFGHKWWIATQAPLRNTAHAFLSVMLQPIVRPPHADPPKTKTTRIRTVVQLTQNIENGRKKADAYFSSDVGKYFVIPPEEGCYTPALKVTTLDRREFKKAHCVQSTVSISPYRPDQRASNESRRRGSGQTDQDQSSVADTGEEVIFKHLLYLSWPDHGVPEPEDRDSLLEFIKLVDRTNRDKSHCSIHVSGPPDHLCPELDPDPPIMIGCSAGVGRTGTLIALSSLLRHYGFLPPPAQPTAATINHDSPLGPLPDDLKDDLVLQEIDSLREQRPGMVQRTEQTLLVYEVLSDAFAKSS